MYVFIWAVRRVDRRAGHSLPRERGCSSAAWPRSSAEVLPPCPRTSATTCTCNKKTWDLLHSKHLKQESLRVTAQHAPETLKSVTYCTISTWNMKAWDLLHSMNLKHESLRLTVQHAPETWKPDTYCTTYTWNMKAWDLLHSKHLNHESLRLTAQ